MRRHLPSRSLRHVMAILLLIAFATGIQAQFTYTTNNNAITITGYGGPDGSVSIPNTINGFPVAEVGDAAFAEFQGVSEVTFPNTVQRIGSGAFTLCFGLTNVTLGNRLTDIGPWAFFSCTNLVSITIPGSVTNIGEAAFGSCEFLTTVLMGNNIATIGDFAFSHCNQLTNLTTLPVTLTNIGYGAFSSCWSLNALNVDPSNPHYSSVDGVLFNKNQTTLIQYPSGRGGAYSMPDTVAAFTDYAFRDAFALTSLTICDRISSIGTDAFSRASLTNVIIGNGVTNIGDYTFRDCWDLKAAYFRGNAPRVGFEPFRVWRGVIVYYLPGAVGWSAKFAGCPTALWLPRIDVNDATFGVHGNRFGFPISWTSDMTTVVEATTELSSLNWFPIGTNTLVSPSYHFTDPGWTNYPARLYRIRSSLQR